MVGSLDLRSIMKKSLKGALAAGAAAVLLLGGAGTLAYWNNTQTVGGGDFASGSLTLTPLNACDTWNLDTGEPGGQPFDPATGTLVPGDTVSKVCTFTIDAVGDHLRATVVANPGTNTGALIPSLTIAATGLEVGGAAVTEITEADDAQTLTVTVSATFDSAADNTTQNLDGTLDDIDIVATQVHN
jgi:alternate signal-mediated exported protein